MSGPSQAPGWPGGRARWTSSAKSGVGTALGSSGRMDEAIQQFRAALAIDPNFADAKRNLLMATEQGKGQKAKGR